MLRSVLKQDNIILFPHSTDCYQGNGSCVLIRLKYCIYITKTFPCNILEIFKVLKTENFQHIFFYIFLIVAQIMDCRFTLEPPHQGGSNEYPQSMSLKKNKKNSYTPFNPIFAI